MLDDLHVQRLRQLWIDIARKLGTTYMSLSDIYKMESQVPRRPPREHDGPDDQTEAKHPPGPTLVPGDAK